MFVLSIGVMRFYSNKTENSCNFIGRDKHNKYEIKITKHKSISNVFKFHSEISVKIFII